MTTGRRQAELDANAGSTEDTVESQDAQLPAYQEANAGPTELESVQQDAELPAFLDANGEAASELRAPEGTGEIQVMDALSGNANGNLFYLTNFSRNANQVLTACAAGYHMASLWEIYDPSNLTYDTSHPEAYVKADSGQGPPSLWYGWVRTGFDNSASSKPGAGNCLNGPARRLPIMARSCA
jgi:hypothetical protein